MSKLHHKRQMAMYLGDNALYTYSHMRAQPSAIIIIARQQYLFSSLNPNLLLLSLDLC